MKALTASEARRTLFSLIEDAVELEEEFYITSRKGTAVLVSADVYQSYKTTLDLFKDPVAGMRLLQALVNRRNDEPVVEMTIDELEKHMFGK